jgi:hypothetical protein
MKYVMKYVMKDKPKTQIDDWRLFVVRDGRPKPLQVSKHAKAKLPKGARSKREPIGLPKVN